MKWEKRTETSAEADRKNTRMRQKRRLKEIKQLAVSSLLAVVLSACGQDKGSDLRGSIGQEFDLSFDAVQIRIIESGDFELRYVSSIPDRNDKEEALNLQIDTGRVRLQPNIPINLVTNSSLSRFRLVKENGQKIEDRDRFPSLKRGDLTLDTFTLLPGSDVSGSFQMRFINGKTLLGSFDGTLEFEN